MRALIDTDLLVYETSFAAQDRETGEVYSFDYAREVLDDKIQAIINATGSDTYTLYLTGPNNFRFNIAKTKPYKGTRPEEKPWHYENLRAYILSRPGSVLTDGIEADDAMCIQQCKQLEAKDTIICSRDKDLRMCPGFHYGWEHSNQPEYYPTFIQPIGYLSLSENRKTVSGGGFRFFYSQLITGDSTDNIPGLPKGGAVLAYNTLAELKSEQELFLAVKNLYEAKLGDSWYEYLLEQAQLLWMVRELDENNNPIMWKPPIDLSIIPEQNIPE